MTNEVYAWLFIVSLSALIVGFLVLAYLAKRVGQQQQETVIEAKRRAWHDADTPDARESLSGRAVRFPPMSEKASKGFNRDGSIGIDQVTPEERRRALRLLGLPPLE